MILKVPNDARTIPTSTNCLTIFFVDLNGPNPSTMLLQRSFHNLSLLGDFPYSNLTLSSSRNNPLAIGCSSYSCASMIVSIVDNIQQFAWLWEKCSNLSIRPAWNNRLSILHKMNTKAFKSRHLYSEELLSVVGIPYPNFVKWSCCEHFWVTERKCNVIDAFIVTGVPKFRS